MKTGKERVQDLVERFQNESEFEDQWDVFDAAITFYMKIKRECELDSSPFMTGKFEEMVRARNLT